MTERSYTEAWLEGPKCTQFYTRTYAASEPRAVIVALHGFIEHVARFEHVHSAFAAHGFTVFTYDQRGFGRTASDKAHKSKDSSYGKTSWPDQLADIEWAVRHAKERYGGNGQPLFLTGQSMGGGLVLAFPTRSTAPPALETVSLISGVLATSPLVLQTHPASKALKWIGGKASLILPAQNIPANVSPEHLSHDKQVNDSFANDPLVRHEGSLRGISDMLTGGEQLARSDYKRWPPNLPVAFFHGTADQVTSHVATQEFYNNIPAKDKTIKLYEGGYHELQNEPDGVKEQVIEDKIAWIEAHLGTGAKL